MVYSEGFELYIEDKIFFAFFHYKKTDDGGSSVG